MTKLAMAVAMLFAVNMNANAQLGTGEESKG